MSALEAEMREKLAEAERKLGITHRDGVPWWRAPLPRRLHRCSPWTVGLTQGVARCACGGFMFLDDPVWMRRNERRRKRA